MKLAPAASASWWFITRKYPPAVGGMERLSYELMTRMSLRRPTTEVVLRRRAWTMPLFMATAAARLVAGCVKGEVAFVHLSDGVLAPLALIARMFRVPVGVTLHGLDVVYDALAYRAWRSAFLRGFDLYVCNSEATRVAARGIGLPGARLRVIGIGVDAPPGSHDATRETDCLLFVGRLVRRKGLAWFVRHVLPTLAHTRPQVRLVVLGDGPEREAIVASARDAGVADRLVWPASRDDATKAQWLARATLCIMPNVPVRGDMEGFGIVALEAAAAACPVVAADLEGLREAVAEGRAGTLVPAADAPAWIRATSELLDDPARRDQAAENARRYVLRHFQWDAIVDAYERAFTEAILARHPRLVA